MDITQPNSRQFRIVPDCCEMAAKVGTVTVGLKATEEGYGGPVWHITYNPSDDFFDIRAQFDAVPRFCPFCGTGLPDLVERTTPLTPICVVTDGGYYCDTCHERLLACRCWPPTAKWETKRT